MDHRQHSTGGSWMMVCDRIIVGLVIFQVSMVGQLALRSAIRRSLLILPLIVATLWFSHVFGRSYKPLMKFIALRSIRSAEQNNESSGRYVIGTRMGQTVDEAREIGLRFINPSLIVP
jgi:hypothetical protein